MRALMRAHIKDQTDSELTTPEKKPAVREVLLDPFRGLRGPGAWSKAIA